MKLLNEVLVKLSRGGWTDRVLYISNLPEHLLYDMRHPMKYVGVGVNNRKEPDLSKDKIATLKEGLRMSPSNDNGIIIDTDREHGQTIWKNVWNYVRQMTPPGKIMPEPKVNSIEPSDPKAWPLPFDQIPRAVLTVLSPPSAGNENPDPVTSEVGTVTAAPSLLNRENNQQKSKRLEKARAALKAKREASKLKK